MKTVLKILVVVGLLAAFQGRAEAQATGVNSWFVVNPQPITVPTDGSFVRILLQCNANCKLINATPDFSEWNGGCAGATSPSACPTFPFTYGPSLNNFPQDCQVFLNLVTSSNTTQCVVQVAYLGSKPCQTQTASFNLTNQLVFSSSITTINLVAFAPPPVSVAVTPANPTISVGGTQAFTATGTCFDGSTFDLTNSVTGFGLWNSSNTNVATMTSNSATALASGVTTISATWQGVTGSTQLSVSSIAVASLTGKWVLFQTSISPTSAGHNCFDAKGTSCYELYANLAQDSNNNLTTAIDPLGSGAPLAIDNSNCGGGQPNVTGNVSGTNSNLSVAENILFGAPGGTFAFNGAYSAAQPLSGWNLDGSPAPFSGTANEIIGTNASSGGCPAQDTSIGFHAWQYPSLGTFDITLNATSQPINLPVVITANLTENTDFSITGSGTLSGPSCGPLNFTITTGETVGNLYGLDATYTNAAGGAGTLSLGLSLITPFVVSLSQLQQAGYTASGPGYALQVWSIDWSASSDGSCAADPITIGFGVASPQKARKHEPHEPKHDKKFSTTLVEILKKRNQQ